MNIQQELQKRLDTGQCSVGSGPDKDTEVWWVAIKRPDKWEFQDGWDSWNKASEASKFYAAHYGLPTLIVRTNPGDNKAAVLQSIILCKGIV